MSAHRAAAPAMRSADKALDFWTGSVMVVRRWVDDPEGEYAASLAVDAA